MHLVLLLVAGLVLATSSKFAAAVSTVSGNSIGCESPPAKRGHGYRDGRCDGCECCPLRWTCLEMHSCGYNCAERTGIPVEELTLDLSSPSWTVGQVVAASTTGIRWSAIPECHSVLPPGLSLHLNTTGDTTATSALSVGGVLEYDPARPAVYTFHFEALAPLGDSYSEQYSLQRVVGKVIVHNARLASDNESEAVLERRIIALTAGDAKARGAGLAGFRAFEEYYHEHRLSHEDSVRRMYTAEHELTSVLDDFPAASSGLYWNWAGGLYMNLHKLLEDVLVDGCEHHFEQALLYNPEDENLEANLNGCMSKRKLESAKFVWLDALHLVSTADASQESLLRSRGLLQHASALKEGWGWGVNNGDIQLTLASVDLCLWAISRADSRAEDADESAIAWRRELLDEAERALAVCQSRNGSQGPAAEWLREVQLFMDSVRAARDDPRAESDVLTALDWDDMGGDMDGGADVWQERTATHAAAIAKAMAPRRPQVLPTPAGRWPARGMPECAE